MNQFEPPLSLKYRDLLCYASQYILDNKLVEKMGEPNAVMATICGKPSVIHWKTTAFDELVVTVWWGYKKTEILDTVPLIYPRPYYKTVDAFVSGFLEQTEGFWIHGHGFEEIHRKHRYCSKDKVVDLRNIPQYQGYIQKEGESFDINPSKKKHKK